MKQKISWTGRTREACLLASALTNKQALPREVLEEFYEVLKEEWCD